MSVGRRYRDRVAEPEVVKLVKLRLRFPQPVALVDTQDDRLAALLEHRRDLLIGGCHTGLQVGDQHDHIRAVDRQLCLPAHLRKDHIVRIRLDPAGVHQHDLPAAPLARTIDPVAGDAGGILHNTDPRTGQFIKQGRLAHIRAADNCNQWFCHGFTSFHQRYLRAGTRSLRHRAARHRYPPGRQAPRAVPPAH